MFNEHMFAFFVFVRVEEINNSEFKKRIIFNIQLSRIWRRKGTVPPVATVVK